MEWANIALTIVLSLIALAGILIKGVGWAVEHALVRKGLVRPGYDGSNWPNGWHNLPDALEGIYNLMSGHQHTTGDLSDGGHHHSGDESHG